MAKETQKEDKTVGMGADTEENAGGREAKKTKPAMSEPAYPVSGFAGSARSLFGTRPECVVAALKAAGKQEYTMTEAKEIVKRFLKKEVR